LRPGIKLCGGREWEAADDRGTVGELEEREHGRWREKRGGGEVPDVDGRRDCLYADNRRATGAAVEWRHGRTAAIEDERVDRSPTQCRYCIINTNYFPIGERAYNR